MYAYIYCCGCTICLACFERLAHNNKCPTCGLDYNPLKLSSFEVGEYAIQKYTELVEKNISLIKPIYLNEYKVDTII